MTKNIPWSLNSIQFGGLAFQCLIHVLSILSQDPEIKNSAR